MVDTAFSAADVNRFGSCYGTDPTGARFVSILRPANGRAARVSVGAAGLVSTVDDLHAFGRMLLSAGGYGWLAPAVGCRRRDDHRPDRCRAGRARAPPDGSQGWGFGVGVQSPHRGLGPAGSYGWAGGGRMWANDPSNRSSASCSAPTFVAPSPRRRSSRTSGPASMPPSMTER